MITGIYKITNKINNHFYIGQSVDIKARFRGHIYSAFHLEDKDHNSPIHLAIAKYGKDNFKVELITQVEDDTWEYWEQFYIKQYKTHYSQGGYNITWGGDSNPMDIPDVVKKHKEMCNTPEAKKRYSEQAKKYNHSEKRKEVQKIFNERYKNDPEYLYKVTAGFRRYNESRKIRVGMIENDVIIKEFDSLSDACKYLGITDKSVTAHINRYADKFNKNGKRSKFLGYSWTRL